MFCASCGNEIMEGSKFCEHCGAAVEDLVPEKIDENQQTLLVSDSFENQTMAFSNNKYEATALVGQEQNIDATESVVLEKKKKSKKKIIIAIVVALLAIAVGIGAFFAVSGGDKVGKLLDLGDKYLEEQDYDSAIAAFNKVLKIDPKNADAYLGIVEVYIRQGEYDKAIEIAEKGYEITHDERLQEKIDMIKSGNIVDSKGRCLKLSFYDGDGKLVAYHTYTYDAYGRADTLCYYGADGSLIDSIQCEYKESGEPLVSFGYVSATGELIRHEYTYKKGKIAVDTSTYMTGAREISKFEYEGNNRVLEAREYISAEGDITRSYLKNEYNKKGLHTKTDYLDEDMNLTGYTTYKYDDNYNLLETVFYDRDGRMTSKTVNHYDSDGNIIGCEGYDAEGNLLYSQKSE